MTRPEVELDRHHDGHGSDARLPDRAAGVIAARCHVEKGRTHPVPAEAQAPCNATIAHLVRPSSTASYGGPVSRPSPRWRCCCPRRAGAEPEGSSVGHQRPAAGHAGLHRHADMEHGIPQDSAVATVVVTGQTSTHPDDAGDRRPGSDGAADRPMAPPIEVTTHQQTVAPISMTLAGDGTIRRPRTRCTTLRDRSSRNSRHDLRLRRERHRQHGPPIVTRQRTWPARLRSSSGSS